MRARAERGSRAWRCAASGLLALAASLATSAARADDSQQFELVKGLFYAGQYEEVVRRIGILLDPSNPACASVEGAPTAPQTCHLADQVLVERSREMQVVALVALKRQADADAVIEKMVRQNPAYSPEPGSLPTAVVQRFGEIKARLQKELEDRARNDADAQRKTALQKQRAAEEERKWLAEMTKLASQETVIEKRSRLLAFVPFGVGQLQNGDTALGILFAGASRWRRGPSIGFGTMHNYYSSVNPRVRDPNTGNPVNVAELNDRIQVAATANQIAVGLLAGLVIAGIIQANVAFVPEVRTTRDREVPKRPAPAGRADGGRVAGGRVARARGHVLSALSAPCGTRRARSRRSDGGGSRRGATRRGGGRSPTTGMRSAAAAGVTMRTPRAATKRVPGGA